MQEENFRKAFIGYHKEDVTNHIENLMIDNRRAIKLKEENIQNLQKRVSELELNVTRLSEIENQFLSVQEKLQHETQALEEKNKKINLLSLRADELQEKLNQMPEVVEPDHSREEALEAELMLLKNELLLVRKEKDETSLQYDQLKENIDSVRERELEYEKNYESLHKKFGLIDIEHQTLLNEKAKSDLENEALRVKLSELVAEKESMAIELKTSNDELSRIAFELSEMGTHLDEIKLRKEELENQVSAYQDKMKAYKEREALLEREKIVIAYAILRAQEKADEMDKELEVQYSIENERLKNYKKEIESFRMKAIEVLQLFEEELSMLSNEGPSSTTDGIKPETNDSSLKSHTLDTAGSPQIQLIKRG